MKKLLIFMLVLGMASVANATLQISVSGIKEPIDSEIVVVPSEYLVLDIWTDADITPGVGEGYWGLAAKVTDATISGGEALWPDAVVYDDWAGSGAPGVPEGDNGVFGGVTMHTSPIIPAGSVIVDLIEFHCEWAVNDVVVTLYADALSGSPVPIDSVIIHQIPEPMTIALLGLGGLFLRRRK